MDSCVVVLCTNEKCIHCNSSCKEASGGQPDLNPCGRGADRPLYHHRYYYLHGTLLYVYVCLCISTNEYYFKLFMRISVLHELSWKDTHTQTHIQILVA